MCTSLKFIFMILVKPFETGFCYVAQAADFKLLAFWVLGWQVCTITPNVFLFILTDEIGSIYGICLIYVNISELLTR